jgi:hypothetical protein
MKRIILSSGAILLTGLLLVLALSGCTITVDWANQVVYAKLITEAGDAITEDAIVTLWEANVEGTDVADTATEAAYTGVKSETIDGRYNFTISEGGVYILQAEIEDSNLVFADVPVDITETSLFLGNLIGVEFAGLIGIVQDAKEEGGIADVEVTLETGEEAKTVQYTTTTDDDGEFSFNAVQPGIYTLNAELEGYAFITREVQVTKDTVDLGILVGFASEDPFTVSLIVTWGSEFADVDAVLTVPSDADLNLASHDSVANNYDPAATTAPTFSEPYAEPTATAGFYPDGGGSREIIFTRHKITANTLEDLLGAGAGTEPAISLDRDDTDGVGPETISIRTIPYPLTPGSYSGFTISTANAGAPPELLPSGDYEWVGVLEYYVHAYADNAQLADEGAPGGAEVVVYVIQGDSVKGRYILPDYTDIRTASILKINAFLRLPPGKSSGQEEDFFQIVPDIRVVGSDPEPASPLDYQDWAKGGVPTNPPALWLQGRPR